MNKVTVPYDNARLTSYYRFGGEDTAIFIIATRDNDLATDLYMCADLGEQFEFDPNKYDESYRITDISTRPMAPDGVIVLDVIAEIVPDEDVR